MPKRFEIFYTRRAVKDIRALDALVKKRLGKRLQRLRQDPVGLSQKLVHPKLGQYRCRIGDYRVIFDLHGDKLIVLRVGHRREIYR